MLNKWLFWYYYENSCLPLVMENSERLWKRSWKVMEFWKFKRVWILLSSNLGSSLILPSTSHSRTISATSLAVYLVVAIVEFWEVYKIWLGVKKKHEETCTTLIFRWKQPGTCQLYREAVETRIASFFVLFPRQYVFLIWSAWQCALGNLRVRQLNWKVCVCGWLCTICSHCMLCCVTDWWRLVYYKLLSVNGC